MSKGDRRTVATDALETLGTLDLGDNPGRDAIHLAVEPAVAGEMLHAGMDVMLTDGLAYQATRKTGVGIVDPFIERHVKVGERFWLVVYPRQITSLRHVWTHPAFPPSEVEASETEQSAKARSQRWLEEFIARSDCPSFWEVIGKAVDHATGGGSSWDKDYLHFDGTDAHGEIPSEFWDHIETFTGVRVVQRATYFSCSC